MPVCNQSVENAGVAFVHEAIERNDRFFEGWCIIVPIAVIDIFNEKRKCCNHRCPVSVYFHMLLLIIYFSAIKTLTSRGEMSLMASTSFGFAQNTIHDFQNTVLNS